VKNKTITPIKSFTKRSNTFSFFLISIFSPPRKSWLFSLRANYTACHAGCKEKYVKGNVPKDFAFNK
jgi:hypothetical protein